MGGLFLQALKLCEKAGLVKLGQVAIDSSKIKANASRAQSRRYQRFSEKEQVLAEKVNQLLAEAQAADQQEDEWFGKGRRG